MRGKHMRWREPPPGCKTFIPGLPGIAKSFCLVSYEDAFSAQTRRCVGAVSKGFRHWVLAVVKDSSSFSPFSEILGGGFMEETSCNGAKMKQQEPGKCELWQPKKRRFALRIHALPGL
jgi:hypothetical protein